MSTPHAQRQRTASVPRAVVIARAPLPRRTRRRRLRRLPRLDALRGAAIVWMAGFHFCFDLNFFGLIRPRQQFLLDPFWTWQRTAIVSLFLFSAGLGQAVAQRAGLRWPRFWRRWLEVVACAMLVSVGSALMFPRGWISFGVLHGMAVMLLLTRLAAPLDSRVLWAFGALAIVLPQTIQHPLFDTRWTNWVGLVTEKPVTEDYVPVLPWLGIMLWGLAAGQQLIRQAPMVLNGPLAPVWRPLARLGSWSLTFYMLHQLVFIGALQAGQSLGWW